MTGRSHFPRHGQNVPKGTQLNNMFEIDELVTAGGMGEVYKGHNIQTKDPVAIKIVLPEFAEDELILELFRKEARILNHLHHEAIVRYYVFSIDAALGLPFLAMEYVDGPSLAERIKEGPLDPASIAILQRHLADGLEKAHQAGVIHRDIAPDNIILPEGRVDRAKIIDFGIARSATAGGGTLLGGQFAGKYNFVSPEQLGLYDGDVTNRSDIYSLGLVLAACALGRPLDMSGSQVTVIEKRRAVPDIKSIAPPLRGLIEAMLQPDPRDRPQSMAEVAEWPTFEEPEPDERTRLYTTPPRAATRHPSRTPTRQPTRQPASPPVRQPSYVPVMPSPPPQSGQDILPSIPPHPAPRSRPAERRHEKGRSRFGMIAGLTVLFAILLAGVGGWAYVEYWSGSWYQEQADTGVTDTQPPGQIAVDTMPPPAIAGDPEPPGSVATESAPPGPTAVDPEPQDNPATEPEPPPPGAVESAQGPAATEAETPPDDEEIAALPNPPLPRFSAAEIRGFVTGYDGGSCFFAFPTDIGEGSAEIIGYGNQRRSFDTLRSTFQARFGFDAAMEMRTVTDDQCVVVEALGRLTSRAAAPLSLDLSHGVLRSGRSLSGTISGLGDRHLALLMLDNFGFVHSLDGYVNREAGTARFEIKEMTTANRMDFQPQLILSVASAQPLQSLALQQSRPAQELFPALLREIAGKPENLSTAVGYFMFGS